MNRLSPFLGIVVMVAGIVVPTVSAEAATYRVVVTCKVPARQPERQLAPNHCRNYVPDGTQTYTARVTDGSGRAVPGVRVHWTDDSAAATFRVRKNPCTTGSNGTCSDELVVRNPRPGMKITVTGTVAGSYGVGYLSFF